MTTAPITHDEAVELEGLYALDALTPTEKAAMEAHLAQCTLDHSELASIGGVVPALASLAEPQGAPAALKRRVLEAYALDNSPRAEPARFMATDRTSAPPARWRAPNSFGWIAAVAAVLVIALVGAWGFTERGQIDQANQRAAEMARAIAALSQPGAQVAYLRGSGTAAGASGFVAVPPGSAGYMVVTDVPAVAAGMTYQAWYIANGKPSSAGTVARGPDGSIIAAAMQPIPGTEVVALTVEPAGGSDQPTSTPIIVGNVTSPS
jgi:anti-sigma-K factor RskA